MKWNFSPLFYSRKLKSMLHWFIIFEFKLCSGTQNNFSIPPKLAKNAIFRFPRPGTSDVIRCVSLWVSVFPTKLPLTEPSFPRFYSVENVLKWWVIQWYIIFVWCWVAAVSGRREKALLIRSFSANQVGSWKKEMWRRKTRTMKMVYALWP